MSTAKAKTPQIVHKSFQKFSRWVSASEHTVECIAGTQAAGFRTYDMIGTHPSTMTHDPVPSIIICGRRAWCAWLTAHRHCLARMSCHGPVPGPGCSLNHPCTHPLPAPPMLLQVLYDWRDPLPQTFFLDPYTPSLDHPCITVHDFPGAV